MSVRHRLLLGAGALLLPVALSPLLLRPTYAIAFACAAAALAIAARGVAYPLALSAIFSIFIGVLGHNPFPNGVIAKLSFVWVAAAILFAVVREEDVLPTRVLMTAPVVLTVATAVWMTVRLGASSQQQYGSFKLQLFVAENLAFLVAGIIVARRRDHFRVFLVLTLAMAGLSAIMLAKGLASGQAQSVVGGRFAPSSDYNPIIFGRDAARAITIAVFFLLVARLTWLRFVSIAMLPLLAVSFTAAGSRGPALGLVVGLFALLALALREREARRRVLLVFAGGLAAAYLVAQLVPGQNVSRSLSFLTGNTADASSNGRTAIWRIAWHAFLQHPLFGVGTGGYAGLDPSNLYPHNLVLETLAEQGIVGGTLVVATIVLGAGRLVTTWRRSNARDRQDAAIVASLLVAAVVNAMFSGDIAVNNAVWLTLGLGVGLRLRAAGVPALPERVAAMRALRRQSGGRRPVSRPGPLFAEGGRQRPGPERSNGRILAPSAGSSVSGVIDVEVEPAQLGRPVALIRLEWESGGGWQFAGEYDDRAFDVATGEGATAIVRSRWLAELIASAVGAKATPSVRRPWSAQRIYRIAWDTTVFPPGHGRLRAVTVDLEGRAGAGDAIELTVEPSRDEAPLSDERAEIVARLRDRREAEAHDRAALASLRDEIAAREQALTVREEQIAVQLAGAEAERAALAARESELAEHARVLALREEEIASTLVVGEAERAAFAAQQSELSEQARVLALREEEIAAQLAGAEAERAALAAREIELAEHGRVVALRESELASNLAAAEVERAAFVVQESQLSERASLLARREEEIAAQLAGAEDERAAVAARESELAEGARAVAAREEHVDSLMAAAEEGRKALAAQESELAEAVRAVAARELELASQLTEVEGAREALRMREADLAEESGARAAREAELDSAAARLAAREQELRDRALEEQAREAELARRAANPPRVELASPATVVRGAYELTASSEHTTDPIRIEVRRADTWAIAPGAGTTLDTTELSDGPVVVRAAAGHTVSEPVELLVDNRAPAVRILSPADGASLVGLVDIRVEATDEISGVHSVLVQRSSSGTHWRPVMGEAWDTTADDDGEWLLRGTAVDHANNLGRSEIVRVRVANAAAAAARVEAERKAAAVEAARVEAERREAELEAARVEAERKAAAVEAARVEAERKAAAVEAARVEAARPQPTGSRVTPQDTLVQGSFPTLYELGLSAAAEEDPYRREELEVLLFTLRDWADVDGVLPPEFHDLVREEFRL